MHGRKVGKDRNPYPLKGRPVPVRKSGSGSDWSPTLSAASASLGKGLASCKMSNKEDLRGASATPGADDAEARVIAAVLLRAYAGRRAGWLATTTGQLSDECWLSCCSAHMLVSSCFQTTNVVSAFMKALNAVLSLLHAPCTAAKSWCILLTEKAF